jgi:hypothetical protein
MPKRVIDYARERQEVLTKIFIILGINENNNTFMLHELDANIDKQKQILALEPDIKKYFICGLWSCFKKIDMKRRPLSFVKNVSKDCGYIAQTSRKYVKNDDNTTTCLTIYKIFKNNI